MEVEKQQINVTTTSQDGSFGDQLAELLRTLPQDASTLFLKSLSGLSPSESGDFCKYVAKINPEKQYRVVKAMAESTMEGKRIFLTKLAPKFAKHAADELKAQEQEAKELEAHVKRKEALDAAKRVKEMNGGTNKHHSYNAIIGVEVKDGDARKLVDVDPNAYIREKLQQGGGADGDSAALSSNAFMLSLTSKGTYEPVPKSQSSSSITITKKDITDVQDMFGSTSISQSEQLLRELEIHKLKKTKSPQDSEEDSGHDSGEDDDLLKRDRPESNRALLSANPKPTKTSENIANGTEKSQDDTDAPGAAEDAPTTKRWTKSQDAALRESVRIHGEKNWKAIAELVPGRNHAQCLQRWRKVLKPGLVKGHWSFEEDQVLEYLVTQGCNNWGQIAERIPGRTPKQCRERWKNHLDPAINKGPYTEDEDTIILSSQARLGNKWSQIAQLLKGRTEDSVKIRWKSLKQNPSKAAASHAQHKKNQAQQAAMLGGLAVGMGGLSAYGDPNALRQRHLQLMQQQQHLANTEAAQLDIQQQMHQHQMQQRLQEKLYQQHQAQYQPQIQGYDTNDPTVNSHTTVKQEPYAQQSMQGLLASRMTPHDSMTYGQQYGQNNFDNGDNEQASWDFQVGNNSFQLPDQQQWQGGVDNLLPSEHHTGNGNYGGTEEYDESMFEKLASELGGNTMQFASFQ